MPKGKEKICPTCKNNGYTLTRVNVTDMWKRVCPTCNGMPPGLPREESPKECGRLARIYDKLERC